MRTPPGPRRRPLRPRPRTSGRWRRRTPARASRRRSGASGRRPARATSSSPRSRMPIRSASASASSRSCVQSRIVASCFARTSRMNSCTSSFERGSRPVVGSSSRSSTGEVRSARASATFCCIPRERFSIGSVRRSGGKPTRPRISGICVARLLRAHAVEAGGVVQVLARRHLLEERGLDRDAVDELLHRPRLGEDVVPEHLRAAPVVEEQRREQPDERRLAGAVLAQDRDALAPLDRERDAVDGGAALAHEPPRLLVAPDEILAQIAHVHGRHRPVDSTSSLRLLPRSSKLLCLTRISRTTHATPALRRAAATGVLDLGEESHEPRP